MKENTQYAIGIDLGGTNIKGALMTAAGRIAAQDQCSTEVRSGVEGVAGRIVGLVNRLKSAGGISDAQLRGVGVGIPGVTTEAGVVILAPNLHWRDVPFKHILEGRLSVPVAVDNDANVAALAEARVGVGAGCDTLVLMTLGTGIGGGIVMGGRIHHGASHSAGEVGHMCVLPDGPTCGCGRQGCLEALTSGPAMVRFVQQGLAQGRESALDEADLTPRTICEAAEGGDALCQGAVAQAARYLGIAIANLINVLSPDVIAIGGGISAAGDVLFTPIVASARAHTLDGMFDDTRIALATLGNDAGSLGAGLLVL